MDTQSILNPLVSVIMSVHNGERYVGAAIESILAQSFRNFEFLILDDASTDGTASILRKYAHRDNRILLLRNETNEGQTLSLNTLLGDARGIYIAVQDADDISLPARIAEQWQLMEQYPGCAVVNCGYRLVGTVRLGKRSFYPNLDNTASRLRLLFENVVCAHSACFVRRAIIQQLGGYNAHYRYAQDFELLTRLLLRGHVFKSAPDVLVLKRRHNLMVSMVHQNEQLECAYRCMQRNLYQLFQQSVDAERLHTLQQFLAPSSSTMRASVQAMEDAVGIIFEAVLPFEEKFRCSVKKGDIALFIGKRWIAWGIRYARAFDVRATIASCIHGLRWMARSSA